MLGNNKLFLRRDVNISMIMIKTNIYSLEKGILKKPGPPYCPLDKDRWEERLSSSSQNNLVNLTGGLVDTGVGGPGRQQIPERPDSRRTEISDVERTLKSLNGYHEDILEVGRSFTLNEMTC